MSIITSNHQDKNEISSSIDTFFKQFHLSTIAKKSNAKKSKGVSFLVLFSYLVTAIFLIALLFVTSNCIKIP